MNRILSILLTYLMVLFVLCSAFDTPKEEVSTQDIEMNAGFTKFITDIEPIVKGDEPVNRTSSRLEIINNIEPDEEAWLSQSDIELLATIVRAEAGNQTLDGKRAVADVILNRVDSEQFPNTIQDVIYQDGQFNCMDDGNFAKAVYTKDETDFEAVMLELEDRTDSEIIYFQTDSYSSYGTPAYVIGDHYFAKK